MSNRPLHIILRPLAKMVSSLLTASALFACAAMPTVAYLSPDAATPPGPSTSAASPAAPTTTLTGPRLSPADTVRITVYGETGLSGDFSIGPDGVVTLPLIGQLPATGLSCLDLQAAITAALQQGFLTSPRVSVELISRRPFYILGEVNKPGEYPFSPDMTVLNAVAMAQGFTYRANSRRVFIRHAREDHERRIDLTPATPVQPGDTLRIGERYF